MQAEVTSFWEWQQQFSDEKRCLQALIKLRWPDGFVCGCCGHRKGWLLQTSHVYECAGCHHHTSITASTLFHNTKLPLVKWFWCIYWMSTDKGSISALRLTKLAGVSWITAHRMLRKLRLRWATRTACTGWKAPSNWTTPLPAARQSSWWLVDTTMGDRVLSP